MKRKTKQTKSSQKNEQNSIIKEIGSWIMVLVFAVILAIIIKTFIFNTTLVDGTSMYPTLEHGDRLISLKFTYLFKKPSRGQVVIFHSPIVEGDDYIKRVIGIEGDEVRIEDGKVYVNEKKVDEYYIEDNIETLTEGIDHWKVGEDELFVLGDNRQFKKSTDSRVFGTISTDEVSGQAVFRYFPLNKIGVVK